VTPRQIADVFVLALVLTDVWIVVAVVRALHTGSIRNLGRFQRGMVPRADSPRSYWITLAAHVVTAGFLAYLAIMLGAA